MRAQARQSSQEEEEESAFISMTDMTVGFLFIVMILLAFFASQFRVDNLDTVPKKRFEAEEIARKDAEGKRDAFELALQEAQDALAKKTALNVIQRKEILRLQEKIKDLERKLAELEASMRDPLEAYLGKVAEARNKLLKQLERGLKEDFPFLKVKINEDNGALQFQGEGLFASNSYELAEDKKNIVRRIAFRLNEVLPCYTLLESFPPGTICNNPNVAIIEAVQIEGHTDAEGTPLGNIVLSAGRATTTFGLMVETVPELREYKNHKGQSVMSFAGYGQDRPIDPSNTKEAYSTNRRIDLRFIMVTPSSTDEIVTIRARFNDLVGSNP